MAELALNPYTGVDWDETEQHKAQFHAHTSHPPTEGHSGSDPPDEVIDDYAAADYSVLALTGHEYNIEGPTWPWTDWDRDPDDLGMVAVPGVELSIAEGETDYDLLSLFCDVADTDGMSVDEALAANGDRGGLSIFPHPGRYHDDGEWYVEHFRAHPNLLGVEVVNAADRYPTDRDIWDDLQGRLGADRPVWGFANDDYHGRNREYSFDRSRNVLLLDELSETAVRNALVEGRFFYQHVVEGEPPAVGAVRHDRDRGELAVEAPDAEVVQWISEGSVVSHDRSVGYRRADDIGTYLRVRLVGESGSETGTQPFLLE